LVIYNDKVCATYRTITDHETLHPEMLLDTGILRLKKGEDYVCSRLLERAYLLIEGDVEFSWDGIVRHGVRHSCFDEEPVVLQVPSGMPIRIKALENSEICVERVVNDKAFDARFYEKKDTRTDIFGEGPSLRSVRTVFDGEIAPLSNMVMGEVINHPGGWSSYPPHDHPQPEIYYYKMFPKQGFGVSMLEDDAYIVHDGDASLIEPGHTHSQVAAPGYAMYYVWMIAHLPNDRWLPTTRYYRKEHQWLLEKGVKIWPERHYEGEAHE
jgi:5-deoxy-glucuronate isomerase